MTFQEPVFIPKVGSKKEGEGYLMALLNHLDVLRNDIVIFDAQNLAQGPIAAIHLPVKLRLGLHGNFVDQKELDDWKERRKVVGSVGPVQPAKEQLPWQKRIMEAEGKSANDANGTNGANDENRH